MAGRQKQMESLPGRQKQLFPILLPFSLVLSIIRPEGSCRYRDNILLKRQTTSGLDGYQGVVRDPFIP